MTHFGDYRIIGELYSTATSVVYRAKREHDQRNVVVKVLLDEYPSAQAIERVRHEYAILQQLAIPGVARALSLEPQGNGLALILEDVSGTSLGQMIPRGGYSVGEFLRIAGPIARSVLAIHDRQVIHKDLKPQHVFFAPSGAIQLIDFGISVALSRGSLHMANPDCIEGTLAYIAPEQTGRMNRPIDERSDLYSLGVIFFEMLAGRLPFPSSDPLELVHSHIAKAPPRLDVLRPEVPTAVANIVDKLLSKMASQRYQSAWGLIADLEHCQREFLASGRVAVFELATEDVSGSLQSSRKLYGRERERMLLQEAVQRSASGAPELLFLTGQAGLGKTSLVSEVKTGLGSAVHFVTGRFTKSSASVPYRGLVEACRELVVLLLAQAGDRFLAQKARLEEALGMNAQVIIELVPELGAALGPQPALPQIGPSESQNRFEHSFERFITTFATAKEPLVIFLDDLHLADAASLRLLERILTAPGSKRLLVIGACSGSSLADETPLTALARALDQHDVRRSEVSVQPLRIDDIVALLQDTLRRQVGALEPLARLLHQKTQGSPFFLRQFLEMLQKEGLLWLDRETHAWAWDLEQIAARRVTDNVVELLLERLRGLPAEARELLSLGACIGTEFDIASIALIADVPPLEAQRRLQAALHESLLLLVDSQSPPGPDAVTTEAKADADALYRFPQEKLYEAAYALLEASRRRAAHLRWGRFLRTAHADGSSEAHLYEITDQMNRGADLISDETERLELAELNLSCGKRARGAAASAIAAKYLNAALELLGDSAWEKSMRIAASAHLLLAECEYLNGRMDAAFQLLDEVERHSTDQLDRAAAGDLKTVLLTAIGKLGEACEAGVQTLRLLGVEIPSPKDIPALGAMIGAEFAALQATLAGHEIESLVDLPLMTDTVQLAVINMLADTIPAAFQSTQELMVVAVLKGAQLPFKYGLASLSPFFYMQYGLVHSIMTGDYVTSHRFGRLGIAVGNRHKDIALMGPAHFIFAGFISHWREHISVSLEHFELGLARCLEAGDHPYACYCMGVGANFQLYAGHPLDDVRKKLPAAFALIERTDDFLNRGFLRVCRQAVASLTGDTDAFGKLEGPDFSEATFEASSPPPILAFYGAAKAMVRYLAGDYEGVLDTTTRFQPLPGLFYNVEDRFFAALAHAGLAWSAQGDTREKHMKQLEEAIETFAKWAALSPTNHAHRHALLLAEQAALQGDVPLAMERYDEAINGAQAHGFIHNSAIAGELSALFHKRAGRVRVARSYMTDAAYAYRRWGATAKVHQLSRDHADLMMRTGTHETGGSPKHTTSGTGRQSSVRSFTTDSSSDSLADDQLDLESAMRASLAITSELEIDRLIERLLRILIENAGAQRGVLIVPKDGVLWLEAAMEIDPEVVTLNINRRLEGSRDLPQGVVEFVRRTKESLVLDDAHSDQRFTNDDYWAAKDTCSVMCIPLVSQGKLSAIVYLENSAATSVFSPTRLTSARFLAAQAASALDNARLYGEVQLARSRLLSANETLEQRVLERTRELGGRNRDMRRVLDNVKQGLFMIDGQTALAAERSAKIDEWFAGYRAGLLLADFLRVSDPHFATWFELGWDAVVEGTLPLEVCLEQLPKRLVSGERSFEVAYHPVLDGKSLSGVLIDIVDVSERERHTREELRQNEQLAILKAFVKDRTGLQLFFNEGEEMVRLLQSDELAPELCRRILHTLKGNSAMVGADVMARVLHRAEEAVGEGEERQTWLSDVLEHWATVRLAVESVSGRSGTDLVEVARSDLQGLAARVRAGASVQQVVDQLIDWQLEPAELPLARLGEYARALALRLGKGDLEVEVRGDGVRTCPRTHATLWSALVHVVRNAVDHGIESPEARARGGKALLPRITLEARRDSQNFIVEIADDGPGVDWTAIRDAARHAGLAAETDDDLFTALMAPDVTTRAAVTATSGRGVGMDAVRTAVDELAGRIELDTHPGQGCRWTISIPWSFA